MGNVWLRKLEDRHRLRLNEEIINAVPWLSDPQLQSCVCFLGSQGQLQIAPRRPEHELVEEFNTLLAKSQPDMDSSDRQLVAFERYNATQWEVTPTFEAGRRRMSLILPKEMRDLEVIPRENVSVVLFQSGEVFEVWKVADWVSYLKDIKGRLHSLAKNAIDDLNAYADLI